MVGGAVVGGCVVGGAVVGGCVVGGAVVGGAVVGGAVVGGAGEGVSKQRSHPPAPIKKGAQPLDRVSGQVTFGSSASDKVKQVVPPE